MSLKYIYSTAFQITILNVYNIADVFQYNVKWKNKL